MSTVDLQVRHHATLECIVLFDYLLTCRTGLHIGAGKSASLAGSDMPVMRDAAGRPLVPGSSLRGILRAGIASFCDSLQFHRVIPTQDDGADAISTDFAKGWRKLKLVERLFGAIAEQRGDFSYASRLQISDALCTEEVAVELRDGVGIDRETRTASQGVKYDLEVVPAGTEFRGQIRFKNPADYELGLLTQALWMLDQGLLLLGGKSARGLGWMKVDVTTPRELYPQAILDREVSVRIGPPERADFGPIDEKLSKYFDSLQQLADAAAKVA